MHRFLSSLRLPFTTSFILTLGTIVAYAIIHPQGVNVGNAEILKIARIAGWGIGILAGILSFVAIGILNLLRRLFRIRTVVFLHIVVVLAGVIPWLLFSWNLAGEPPYTPLARAVTDFIARPLLWGSGIACIFALLTGISACFFPREK